MKLQMACNTADVVKSACPKGEQNEDLKEKIIVR